MKLNLTELSKAVAAVAGIAAENAALKADMQEAQADVDALTASLIAASTSPAGAVGLAAVAAALPPPDKPIPSFLQAPQAAPPDILENLK